MQTMSGAANYSAFEILRNGHRIEIRALRSEDRDDFLAAVGRASSQSLYRRFFSAKRHFTEKETSFFLNVDFVQHVALVAVTTENERPTIVGGGRYVVEKPGVAEVAFTVVDAYQGQGIGQALFSHLAGIARKAGLCEFCAYVLPENVAMLAVFERSGLKLRSKREGRNTYLTVEL
jgi:GNAT superfamily N-acetyltransferase